MGRPIKKKYFGNTNPPGYGEVRPGLNGVGGEDVAGIVITGGGTLYSQGATASVGAPNITGGIQAVAGITINGSGVVTNISIVNSGTGYTSAPTISIVKPGPATVTATETNSGYTLTNVSSVAGIYVGMRADAPWGMQASTYVSNIGTNSVTLTKTLTASTVTSVTFSDQGSGFAYTDTLTTNRQNAISFTSYLTTGSSAVTGGDIIKQESSRRYLVQNSQGVGICHLSSGTGVNHILTPGNMQIVATDTTGATYYVLRLAARKALVFNRTNTSTAVYKSFKNVPWDTRAAYVSTSGAVVVSITNA